MLYQVKSIVRGRLYEVKKPDALDSHRVTYIRQTSTGKSHWTACNCSVWKAAISVVPKKSANPSRTFKVLCPHGIAVLKHLRVGLGEL